MRGWLDLGDREILHFDEGLLWTRPMAFRSARVEVFDLASGTLRATPWRREGEDGLGWTRPFAGGLAIGRGSSVWRVTLDGTAWERRGLLLDATATHILAATERDLQVWDAAGEVVLALDAEPDDADHGVLPPFALGPGWVAVVGRGVLTVWDLAGRVVETRPVEGEAAVRRVGDGLVSVERIADRERSVTRLAGAVDAVVPGYVWELNGTPEAWVALTNHPSGRHDAVFGSGAAIELRPVPDGCVVVADACVRVVGGSERCMWAVSSALHTAAVRSLERAPGAGAPWWGTWDGVILGLVGKRLTPMWTRAPVPRWDPPGTRHTTVDGEVAASYDWATTFQWVGEPELERFPVANDGFSRLWAPPTRAALDPGEPASLTLRLTPFGATIEAWRTAKHAWAEDPALVFELDETPLPGDAEGDRHLLEHLATHGWLESELVDAVVDPVERAALGAMGLRVQPWRFSLPEDGCLLPFAHDARERVFAVARWPLDRRQGVAMRLPDGTVRWVAPDLGVFLAEVRAGGLRDPDWPLEPPDPPDWFVMAHHVPVPGEMELLELDDPIAQERRAARLGIWGLDAWAGIGGMTGIVYPNGVLPLDDRLAWLRSRLRPLARAVGQPDEVFDPFLDALAARGPLLRALSGMGRQPAGPLLTADVERGNRPMTDRFERGRGPILGLVEVLEGIGVLAYPPHGLVLVASDPERLGGLVLLADDAVPALWTLPDRAERQPDPCRLAWFDEVFGDGEPASPDRAAWKAYQREPSPAIRAALREVFEALGWTLHAAALQDPPSPAP